MSFAESVRRIPIFRRSDKPPVPRRLPIADYDAQTAEQILVRLPHLGQRELALVEDHERGHAARAEVTGRIVELFADEPWPGYDDEGVEAIVAALDARDRPVARRVKVYEAEHKARAEVLGQATRRIAQG